MWPPCEPGLWSSKLKPQAARAGDPPPRTEGDSFCVGFAEMCQFWDTPGGVVC
jgi:hypothetical protein